MRKISRKKGPVTSKVVSYDGITFKSGLEKYMYKALKDANIPCEYEKHKVYWHLLMERVFTIESRTTEVIANNNNLLTILSERIKDLINK